jgi:hypothetical protein
MPAAVQAAALLLPFAYEWCKRSSVSRGGGHNDVLVVFHFRANGVLPPTLSRIYHLMGPASADEYGASADACGKNVTSSLYR